MDAALAETNTEATDNNVADAEAKDDGDQDDGNIDLDLESFGKKKKKKKKPFNLEELDGALPDAKEEQTTESNAVQDESVIDDNFDLDMDFSKSKKKKKKKKDLDELMAETDDKQDDKENGNYFMKLFYYLFLVSSRYICRYSIVLSKNAFL